MSRPRENWEANRQLECHNNERGSRRGTRYHDVLGKVAKRIAQSHSVQPEFALNEAELLRGDQPSMGDANPIERPIKIGGPEIQEIDEFRKVRREVVVLPDIALQ